MSDFRLRVFYTVASLGSFTKAAETLYITQPAVTKHIHELESELGISLFERKGNSIQLTDAGQIVRNHAEHIFDLYRQIEFEVSTLKHQLSGRLRLGASTTIAQYVLPPALALFNQRFPEIRVTLINENSRIIEQALFDKEIDLGLVENSSRNKALKYTPFLDDELVLVTATNHTQYKKDSVPLKALTGIPLVLREKGSGTLEVLEKALRSAGFSLKDLNVRIYLGSSEGIKSYLQEAPCCSIVSIRTVAKEVASGQLRVIKIADCNLKRELSFAHLQGPAEPLPAFFMQFVTKLKRNPL
jgi:DNA-binding transcriptional LysR family regulator